MATGGDPAELDNVVRLFVQYAQQPGNDRRSPAPPIMSRPATPPPSKADLAAVTCAVLVVVGDHDFARPADQLVGGVPERPLPTLRNVDHFATPDSFGFFDAALEFLDAI